MPHPRRKHAEATPPELRQRILDAARELLNEAQFDELSVADVISAAGVSRASFYFYFAGKQAVLAELVRQAVARGHEAAEPWINQQGSPIAAVRHGISEGARLWRDNGGVLRAIVENWGTHDELRALWLHQMDSFTRATRATIGADPTVENPDAVAAALTWLGERLYYLAAAGVPPFDDEAVLVDTLTTIWVKTLYGAAAPSS
jgi:TetR/AcrR family transcriptional regulator, ethionamide resistance regulator